MYHGISGQPAFPIQTGGYIVNGFPSSVSFLICGTFDSFNILMNALQFETYSDYIITCFTVPKLAVSGFMNSEHSITNIPDLYILSNKIYDNNMTPTTKTLISTPSSLDGYTPRNQKLRTYPYLYLGFNPENGSSKIYRYEDFSNGTPQFKIISEVNPNPSVCFIPQNYRGVAGDSIQDLASLSGYPTLSSKSDYFNSWLAQNSEIISLQMQQEQFNYDVGQVTGALNVASNIAGGIENGAGGNYSELVGSAMSSINGVIGLYANTVNHEFYQKQQMAQIEKQKLLPDKVTLSSSNATLIGYNMNDKNIFTRYNIKRQFAEKIDKFFDMYGYITNTVKIPNLNNRPNWNYVKTIGANILANIPQNDLQAIKNIFDNGITLWHNPNTFLDYSQNNR